MTPDEKRKSLGDEIIKKFLTKQVCFGLTFLSCVCGVCACACACVCVCVRVRACVCVCVSFGW